MKKKRGIRLRLHPLFIVSGVWYCFKGELFLFLLSCLVAIQHECAHAFAAARLGYRLRNIVLMPFGAVIDGDLRGLTLKDEIYVAAWGPLCNLFTAALFAAIWWFEPTVYAFTDTAYTASLTIALVNLLPAYPLDGGRILKGLLARAFTRREAEWGKAEKRAEKICRGVTFLFAATLAALFIVAGVNGVWNFSLAAFVLFLLGGASGNRDKRATYDRMDFSCVDALKKGVVLRRVAVLDTCPVKNALRYIARGEYLVLEVYDKEETYLFDLPQNELSAWFLRAKDPYVSLRELAEREGLARGDSSKRACTCVKTAQRSA